MMGILEQSIFHHICESHRQVECQSNELNHFWAKQIYLSDSDSGNLFHRYNVSIEKYQKNTENEPVHLMVILIYMSSVVLHECSSQLLVSNSVAMKRYKNSRARYIETFQTMEMLERNSRKLRFLLKIPISENLNSKNKLMHWM